MELIHNSSVGDYTCKWGDKEASFKLKMRVAVTFKEGGNDLTSGMDTVNKDIILGETKTIECSASTSPTQEIRSYHYHTINFSKSSFSVISGSTAAATRLKVKHSIRARSTKVPAAMVLPILVASNGKTTGMTWNTFLILITSQLLLFHRARSASKTEQPRN